MTELTHDQQLWINLLAIFGFIFIAFAAGGYITDKHIKKEERQQAKYFRRRLKQKYQEQQDDIDSVYSSLGNYYIGMNKRYAICLSCRYQIDNKCFCKDKPKRFTDDTGAMADCSCYQKQECEKGQKNNYSEQHSE